MNLTPEQDRVISYRGDDLQIVACAGAGKTEAISRRVAGLLHEGVEPRAIIAFTFTEKAGAELKERIYRRAVHGEAVSLRESRGRGAGLVPCPH
jgi:DNA helicase-2/ATP-dependent DNA helicase PcrA